MKVLSALIPNRFMERAFGPWFWIIKMREEAELRCRTPNAA
jgi:hypothetical protein